MNAQHLEPARPAKPVNPKLLPWVRPDCNLDSARNTLKLTAVDVPQLAGSYALHLQQDALLVLSRFLFGAACTGVKRTPGGSYAASLLPIFCDQVGTSSLTD
jgi:hypothetical protein